MAFKESKKVELARDISRRLMHDSDVLAVLLVGSVATGLDSEDSDLDIAAIRDSLREIRQDIEYHDAVRVGIEHYPAREFLSLPATPLLDIKALRNCGRFFRGHVLESRWPELKRIKSSWRNALLHPDTAIRLFNLADRSLNPPASYSDFDRFWEIQGAASVLTILTLSMAPCRFQKPKWVIHDLQEIGATDLLKTVRFLYTCEDAGAETAGHVLQIAEQGLAEGCELGGIPPLSFDPVHDEDAMYIYQTHCDAASLIKDGSFEGSVYTSLQALRIMNTYLKKNIPQSKVIDQNEVMAWRARLLKSLFATGIPGANELREPVRILQRDVKRSRQEYLARVSESTTLNPEQMSSLQLDAESTPSSR